MQRIERRLSLTFQTFIASGKAGGALLILCTLVSLAIANSSWSAPYLGFWQHYVAGLSIEHWINDALMAVFFLLVGLELKRELVSGELSDLRNAMLPVVAAAGGIAAPALIHFLLNGGTPTQAGVGIPMATDIAFALGVLALLGKRVPASLKVFLTALAVMDDLGAIIVIALFYTAQLSIAFLAAALATFGALWLLKRRLRVMALWPYLLGGALMWFLMLQSGVHATIAGVLLAFAIPGSERQDDAASPSHRLEHALHTPVALLILPVFALNCCRPTASASCSAWCWASRSASCCSALRRSPPASAACRSTWPGATCWAPACWVGSASRCRFSSPTWHSSAKRISSPPRRWRSCSLRWWPARSALPG